MSSPTINEDCLYYIMQCVANSGDYRTLARVMLLSKTYFAVVAPILYGSLFQPALGDVMENWSEVKKRKLGTLLLVSSGIINQDVPPQNNDLVPSSFSSTPAFSDFNSEQMDMDTWSRFQMFGRRKFFDWRPRFATPTTIPYDRLLKFMDHWLFDYVQEGLAADSEERLKFWLHFAPLIHQIDGSCVAPQLALTNTAHLFQNLSTVNWGYKRENDLLKSFVLEHCKIFPGQIKSTTDSEPDVLEAIRPIELTIGWNIALLPTQSRIFSRLTCIDISGWLISTSAFQAFGSILQQCRSLETVQSAGTDKYRNQNLMSRLGDDSNLRINHFEWAAEEWRQRHRTLVPVKKVVLPQLHVAGFKSCLDGFRDTLEHVCFLLTNLDRPLDWNWVLPKLTVLELQNMEIDLPCIELCPTLEVLKLVGVRGKRTKGWSAPAGLRIFHMVKGHSFYRFKFACLENLKLLTTINWSCDGTTAEFEQAAKRINKLKMDLWRFDKLEDVQLSGGALRCWQDHLPTTESNLARFVVQDYLVKQKTYTWPLSLDLLKRLAQFEMLEILDLAGSVEDGITDWAQPLLNMLVTASEISSPFPCLRFLFIPTNDFSSEDTNSLAQQLMNRPRMMQVWVGADFAWELDEKLWQKINRFTLPPEITFPQSVKESRESDQFPFPVVIAKAAPFRLQQEPDVFRLLPKDGAF